jgi:hypothetical protein
MLGLLQKQLRLALPLASAPIVYRLQKPRIMRRHLARACEKSINGKLEKEGENVCAIASFP